MHVVSYPISAGMVNNGFLKKCVKSAFYNSNKTLLKKNASLTIS